MPSKKEKTNVERPSKSTRPQLAARPRTTKGNGGAKVQKRSTGSSTTTKTTGVSKPRKLATKPSRGSTRPTTTASVKNFTVTEDMTDEYWNKLQPTKFSLATILAVFMFAMIGLLSSIVAVIWFLGRGL